jgi:hypothetical protein
VCRASHVMSEISMWVGCSKTASRCGSTLLAQSGTTKAVTSVAGHERYIVVITLQLAELDAAVYCMAAARH